MISGGFADFQFFTEIIKKAKAMKTIIILRVILALHDQLINTRTDFLSIGKYGMHCKLAAKLFCSLDTVSQC